MLLPHADPARWTAITGFVVEHARKLLDADRVLLFGSRARGDYQAISDIDLAFEFPAAKRGSWSSFVSEVEENLPTLLEADLVDLERCEPALRSAIEREGVVLFAKR